MSLKHIQLNSVLKPIRFTNGYILQLLIHLKVIATYLLVVHKIKIKFTSIWY